MYSRNTSHCKQSRQHWPWIKKSWVLLQKKTAVGRCIPWMVILPHRKSFFWEHFKKISGALLLFYKLEESQVKAIMSNVKKTLNCCFICFLLSVPLFVFMIIHLYVYPHGHIEVWAHRFMGTQVYECIFSNTNTQMSHPSFHESDIKESQHCAEADHLQIILSPGMNFLNFSKSWFPKVFLECAEYISLWDTKLAGTHFGFS